jgi:hypothetical protein
MYPIGEVSHARDAARCQLHCAQRQEPVEKLGNHHPFRSPGNGDDHLQHPFTEQHKMLLVLHEEFPDTGPTTTPSPSTQRPSQACELPCRLNCSPPCRYQALLVHLARCNAERRVQESIRLSVSVFAHRFRWGPRQKYDRSRESQPSSRVPRRQ